MPAERKRPFYLVLALLGALALGAQGAYWGWSRAALYHSAIDPSVAGEGIADDRERARVVARAEASLRALDLARSREWPLAVASLLLGTATMLFAMRAMAGSPSARGALIQVVLGQAALHAGGHLLLRDVAEKQYAIDAQALAEERTTGTPVITAATLRAYDTAETVLHALASALIVVGLTRRSAREFFRDAASPVGQR